MDNNVESPPQRQPHAVLDLASRRWKGMKIERLLALEDMAGPIRILEIGTGSGGIAHYFGSHPELDCVVTAVDLHDNRLIRDGFVFHLVAGPELPFEGGSFDVVISNHVIEHVGERDAQLTHLVELRRVLRGGGVAYLAVPNRWMLLEPHYRLPFLSWLPRSLRSTYVRLAGKGEFYDCEPLTLRELKQMLDHAGLSGENLGVAALRETIRIEQIETLSTWVLRFIPDSVLEGLGGLMPTLVFEIRQRHG